jgi:capsid protein
MDALIPTTERLHRRTGYTIDEDGRSNNYAIEPEMYVDEPGDLKAAAEKAKVERLRERAEIQQGEAGKPTLESDWRDKGPGIM